MLVTSPQTKKQVKPNRRVLSGGTPAQRKRKTIFQKGPITGGSSPTHGRRIHQDTPKKKRTLPAFTPWKVILASFLIGVCGILYIGHVFSTQQTLLEVQKLEADYNKAMRLYNEQRLAYDRLVGPKEIYQKAQEKGFVNAGPADQIIHLKP
ncbi:hypothetical protein [Rhodohalobacter mucosus]|uniref:Uncharacterized protein n=1 Tax=Rhodohalobacter mucosus TaxID=2079485 RepID=A0A316TWN0_9BACT|nr:hypothetical protein [Rhodohalobacter mucosus]PWN06962.1 hypothetical protein DDZ15_06730 [Rhodohalobacter mucosus]